MAKLYYFFYVKVVVANGLESIFLQIGKFQIYIGNKKDDKNNRKIPKNDRYIIH